MTKELSKSDFPSSENTLLYVFSPSKQERRYQLQMETLADRQIALNDHHVTIAEIFEHEDGHVGPDEIHIESSDGLRREYHILPGQFKVVLVGKDASVKMQAESCISCEEVILRVEKQHAEEFTPVS